MRLATIWDLQTRATRPVIDLAGRPIELAMLFHAMGRPVPAYAREMIEAVQHVEEIRSLAESYLAASRDDALLPVVGAFLPPVPMPRTFRDFYAFEQHVATCRGKRGLKMEPAWYEQPVFYFSNPVSLVGHEQTVYAPAGCAQLDYELELGLIIGRGGKDIAARDAWDHIAGFTIINDLSARDVQRREMSVGLGPAKGKDFATAVGPWLVTLDDLRDKIDDEGRVHLAMSARVNGRELSRGDAAMMHFTWPRIIEQASRDAMLMPGDLLGSGTVGTGCILELGPETTGGWLKAGDVVELEIERLGVLRTPIVARPDQRSEARERKPEVRDQRTKVEAPCPST